MLPTPGTLNDDPPRRLDAEGRDRQAWALGAGDRAGAEAFGPLSIDQLGTLLRASAGQIRLEDLESLLSEGVDPDAAGPSGTPLFAAARAGWALGVEKLLAAGADPNAEASPFPQSSDTLTPLGAACRAGSLPCVRLLLDAGADPLRAEGIVGNGKILRAIALAAEATELDENFFAPSFEADRCAIVRLLVEAGAGVDPAPNEIGALQEAAAARSSLLVSTLIELGADPNALDAEGLAPLHRLASTADGQAPRIEACARLLVSLGADPTLRSLAGRSAQEIARAEGSESLVDLFGQLAAEAEMAEILDAVPPAAASGDAAL